MCWGCSYSSPCDGFTSECSRYGFRDMTTAEKLANFVSWRDIGIRMGIKDIPEDLEALEKWQEEYEVKHKV